METLTTGPRLDAEARAFLQQFPTHRAGPLATDFHTVVRRGTPTPEAVVRGVVVRHQERLTAAWATEEDRDHSRRVIEILTGERRAAALRYAAYVLTYEALPWGERQRLKAARGLPYAQAAIEGKPVTKAQNRFLRDLGFRGEVPDRKAASALIDRLQAERRGGSR